MKNILVTVIAATVFPAMLAHAADDSEKTVFVTSSAFNSNLGGLAGADAKCQAAAEAASSIVPAGTYMAWLSDGTNSPDTRFTRSTQPYVLPDGKKIAENYDDLVDGSILNPISLGPNGKPIGYQTYWTGTNPDGTTASDSDYSGICGGWAVEPPAGKYGMNGHSGKKSTFWSTGKGYPCRRTLKLACFQQ